jgi:hypothetical protein
VTAPAPSGGPSPLRVGGLALLGVGVVAAIIGLAALATGSGGDDTHTAAPAPTASSTPEPAPTGDVAPPAAATPTDGSVPIPSFSATPTNGIAAPPTTPPPAAVAAGAAGAGGAAAAGGGGAPVVRAPVRVYNNSTISGLAAVAAEDFRSAGWQVEQVANYPSGRIPTSTVYFRPGTAEQQAAALMGGEFGLRVEQRFDGLDEASPGLIVIVTDDYQRR